MQESGQKQRIVGLFVGGASRRMGRAKGLLPSVDGERTLVQRLYEEAQVAFAGAEVLLVGQQPEYDVLGYSSLADEEPGAGPLSGLLSLLNYAEVVGAERCIALACDLPFIDAALLTLLDRPHDGLALAPRIGDYGQPFFASYRVEIKSRVEELLKSERRSLQPLLKEAERLSLTADQETQLKDWDSPEDLPPRLRRELFEV